MAKHLSSIYYSPKGYWRGKAAVTKLASAAKVSPAETREWLKKQAVWQIYQPVPRRIPRPMLDEDRPNTVHQADLLYLPHDKVGRKKYKYALTLVDVASRYKKENMVWCRLKPLRLIEYYRNHLFPLVVLLV